MNDIYSAFIFSETKWIVWRMCVIDSWCPAVAKIHKKNIQKPIKIKAQSLLIKMTFRVTWRKENVPQADLLPWCDIIYEHPRLPGDVYIPESLKETQLILIYTCGSVFPNTSLFLFLISDLECKIWLIIMCILFNEWWWHG